MTKQLREMMYGMLPLRRKGKLLSAMVWFGEIKITVAKKFVNRNEK